MTATAVAAEAPAAARRAGLVPDLPTRAWLVLGGDALSALGSGLTLPFLFIYLTQVRGLDLSTAGAAAAMIPLLSFLGNPLGGWAADRGGARNAVIGGLTLAAGGSLALIGVDQAWEAFAACGLVGLGASVIWPAQDALLAGTVPPEQRSAVFSVRMATMNAGLGAGSLLAAGIVDVGDTASFTLLYVVDAATFLIFIPLLLTLPARTAPTLAEVGTSGGGGYRAVFSDKVFRRLWLLTALVVAASYGQYHAGFPAYAARPEGVDAAVLGFAFAANTVTVVGAQLVVLRKVAGRRRTTAVRWACGGFAAAWALTLAAGTAGSGTAAASGFVAAMVVFGLAETLLAPTLPAMVNDLAPDHLRGRYNGAATLAWTTGFLTGPLLAGIALDHGVGPLLFAGLIGGCAVAAGGARRLRAGLPAGADRISV